MQQEGEPVGQHLLSHRLGSVFKKKKKKEATTTSDELCLALIKYHSDDVIINEGGA